MKSSSRLPFAFALSCATALYLPPVASAAPGDLDATFDTVGGPDASVGCYAVQPDGKIIVAGQFINLNGTARTYIARLETNGALDATFSPPGTGLNGTVRCLAIQPDGKMIIGGEFTSIDGIARNRIARLNANGTLDASFNPGTGADDIVRCIVQQPDGNIIIGGDFANVNSVGKNLIARLNANGTLDAAFNTGAGPNNQFVYCAALQSDGKIIIGGNFTQVDGTGRNRVARLLATGSLDASFNPGAGANDDVFCATVQPDGKVVIGGDFTQIDSTARIRIARLGANGALDATFDPGAGVSNNVFNVLLQADGKIVIGGPFTSTENRVARLNSSGTLDATFDPGTGANSSVFGSAIQADGKVLIGGIFTQFDGTARVRAARIENGSATGSISVPSLSKIFWMRGGTAPEAIRVTFESTTNGGASWKFLGAGTRIPGGWQITGVSFPGSALIRARAYVPGGQYNGSSGIVEANATAPLDTWSYYHALAYTYYQYYAFFGLYDYATAFYYYYYGIGDFYFYGANGNQALGDFSYYNGFALYFLYLYGAAGYSSYYYYLAFAYYYYFVGVGDFSSANLYYNAYISAAFGG